MQRPLHPGVQGEDEDGEGVGGFPCRAVSEGGGGQGSIVDTEYGVFYGPSPPKVSRSIHYE